jgi:hypothetical protein
VRIQLGFFLRIGIFTQNIQGLGTFDCCAKIRRISVWPKPAVFLPHKKTVTLQINVRRFLDDGWRADLHTTGVLRIKIGIYSSLLFINNQHKSQITKKAKIFFSMFFCRNGRRN